MNRRREIAEDIRAQYGNALSQRQVGEYLSMSHDTLITFVADIPFLRQGRKKTFLAADIARKIDMMQQTAV